jgi:uncharacterized protein (DUF952 family)
MGVNTIYKLLTRAEWEAAQAVGVYRGSAHDTRDGFIHFSTAAQLAGTARRHFSGVADLVLLAVDIERLQSPPSSCPSPARGEGTVLRETALKRERGSGNCAPSPLAGESWGEGGLPLRWEASRGGELFPHLYADLPIAAVKGERPLALGEDGIPILPTDLAP